jgi:hypothetical protein
VGCRQVQVDHRRQASQNGARMPVNQAISVPPVALSDADFRHFSAHGWVALRDCVPTELCDRLRGAMDAVFDELTPWQTENGLQGFSEPHLRSPVFLDLFRLPGLIACFRQLIGHSPRLRHCIALRTSRHPAAETDALRLLDHSRWEWHRDFTPDSIVRATPGSSWRITSHAVVAATYLTAASAESGATAFMDGSHRKAGGYEELVAHAPIVQPSVGRGSIVFFSEAIMHSSTPVTASDSRDAVLTWMTAPWFGGEEVAPFDVSRWKDHELKSIFNPPIFGDSPR